MKKKILTVIIFAIGYVGALEILQYFFPVETQYGLDTATIYIVTLVLILICAVISSFGYALCIFVFNVQPRHLYSFLFGGISSIFTIVTVGITRRGGENDIITVVVIFLIGSVVVVLVRLSTRQSQ
jgi:hypothetical protein